MLAATDFHRDTDLRHVAKMLDPIEQQVRAEMQTLRGDAPITTATKETARSIVHFTLLLLIAVAAVITICVILADITGNDSTWSPATGYANNNWHGPNEMVCVQLQSTISSYDDGKHRKLVSQLNRAWKEWNC